MNASRRPICVTCTLVKVETCVSWWYTGVGHTNVSACACKQQNCVIQTLGNILIINQMTVVGWMNSHKANLKHHIFPFKFEVVRCDLKLVWKAYQKQSKKRNFFLFSWGSNSQEYGMPSIPSSQNLAIEIFLFLASCLVKPVWLCNLIDFRQ